MSHASTFIPTERIERRILLLRGQKVLLDFQLAELYEVEARSLNQAVKRNSGRFPDDFMFQLSEEETEQVMLEQAARMQELQNELQQQEQRQRQLEQEQQQQQQQQRQLYFEKQERRQARQQEQQHQ